MSNQDRIYFFHFQMIFEFLRRKAFAITISSPVKFNNSSRKFQEVFFVYPPQIWKKQVPVHKGSYSDHFYFVNFPLNFNCIFVE